MTKPPAPLDETVASVCGTVVHEDGTPQQAGSGKFGEQPRQRRRFIEHRQHYAPVGTC